MTSWRISDQESGGERRAEALLEQLVKASDNEYAAKEPWSGSRRSAVVGSTIAFGLCGLLMSVAAVQTHTDQPSTEVERQAFVENIGMRQELLADHRETIANLQKEIVSLSESTENSGENGVSLAVATGARAAQGPGIELIVTSAPTDDARGRVRDRDLALLVNGLWLADAQAIAINGQRLTARSAINTAREAIVVNYDSLREPYNIVALGDPEDLEVRWRSGPSGRYFATLENDHGISVRIERHDSLTVKAAEPERMRHHYAEVAGAEGGNG